MPDSKTRASSSSRDFCKGTRSHSRIHTNSTTLSWKIFSKKLELMQARCYKKYSLFNEFSCVFSEFLAWYLYFFSWDTCSESTKRFKIRTCIDMQSFLCKDFEDIFLRIRLHCVPDSMSKSTRKREKFSCSVSKFFFRIYIHRSFVGLCNLMHKFWSQEARGLYKKIV